MTGIKLSKDIEEVIQKSSEDLGISESELLNYLLSKELNYSIAQHNFQQWKNQKKE